MKLFSIFAGFTGFVSAQDRQIRDKGKNGRNQTVKPFTKLSCTSNLTLNYSNDVAVAENNGTAVNQTTAEEIVDDFEIDGNWTLPSNWTSDDQGFHTFFEDFCSNRFFEKRTFHKKVWLRVSVIQRDFQISQK